MRVIGGGHRDLRSRAYLLSVSILISRDSVDEARFIPAGGSQGRNAVKDVPLATGGEPYFCILHGVCWRPPSVARAVSSHHPVFAQCAEPVSQWPVVLPSASVVGGQGQ